MALDWNPQGSRARGGTRNTWKQTGFEEIAKEGKKLATNRVQWR